MTKVNIEKISTFFIWLIVTLLIIFYFRYYYRLKTIYEIVIALTPTIIFFSAGVLVFSRDRKRMRKAKEKEEFGRTIELEWGQALKHDILTYFIPILILALPFFFGQIPNLITLFQAIVVFLALSYLKFIYWNEL